MNQRPVAVGLKVCEKVIREDGTGNITLVNCLKTLRFPEFPAEKRDLVVCLVLTEAQGDVRFVLDLISLADMEKLEVRQWDDTFSDPSTHYWCFFSVSSLVPEPGSYQFTIW